MFPQFAKTYERNDFLASIMVIRNIWDNRPDDYHVEILTKNAKTGKVKKTEKIFKKEDLAYKYQDYYMRSH